MAELDTSGLESYENSEDILIQRQKRERKDLQSQIQKLKHGIPKGDKKKKKEVTDQIKQLEAELNKKHRQELQDLKNSQAESAEVTDKLAALDADLGEKTPNAAEENRVDAKPKKLSKAQKRRDKKSAREKEREDQIKQQESNNLLGPRHVETQKIKAILEQRGLQIYEIASDGNCLPMKA